VTSGDFAHWTAPYLSVLERDFYSPFNNQGAGVAMLMSIIVQDANYETFSEQMNGVHGVPHIFVGGQMQTMFSPSDPLFWSHHSNMDRIFAIWQDCHDYEIYTAAQISSTLYTPFGPVCPSHTTAASYGIDTQIPFTYLGLSTYPFPANSTFYPTPREVYFMGNSPSDRGFDGMYYRYSTDFIVQDFIADNNHVYFCQANEAGWNLVNQSPPLATQNTNINNTKRGISTNTTSSFNASNALSTLDFLQNALDLAASVGLSGAEVLGFIADLECQASTPREVDQRLEMWIIMEGGQLSWYDRSCDNTSARFCANNPNHTLCDSYDNNVLVELRTESEYLMIIAVVEGVAIILLLIILVVVVSFFRQPKLDDGYVSMQQ